MSKKPTPEPITVDSFYFAIDRMLDEATEDGSSYEPYFRLADGIFFDPDTHEVKLTFPDGSEQNYSITVTRRSKVRS